MLLLVAVVLIALALSSPRIRKELPSESLFVVLAVGATLVILFQTERLG